MRRSSTRYSRRTRLMQDWMKSRSFRDLCRLEMKSQVEPFASGYMMSVPPM